MRVATSGFEKRVMMMVIVVSLELYKCRVPRLLMDKIMDTQRCQSIIDKLERFVL